MQIEGDAVVYCEGAFGTTNGKTAHGLVRRTDRYRVCSVIDSRHAGADAGELLDRRPSGVPLVPDLDAAMTLGEQRGTSLSHFVIGLAPDGGRLPAAARAAVRAALERGLHVDSGLHDFLGEDPELSSIARAGGARIRDIRRPIDRDELHFFSGKIEEVDSFRIAVLGTDSAIGKRTTTWILLDALERTGLCTGFVGTGQTAWLQGADHCVIMDSLVNDFVSGEIEHVVWSAWKASRPEVLVIEGQGSLMNPAYPGGFEIMAAGRPHAIVLQHAPARMEYDGFPGYALHPLPVQIQAIELLSGKPVVAITVNHEGLDDIEAACRRIREETGLPAFDVLSDGAAGLVDTLRARIEVHRKQMSGARRS